MRTKAIILSAMLGIAGVVSSFAQNVYSVNVVGYINLNLPAGLSMVANQLDNGNGNLVTELLPAPPIGTTLFKFTGGSPPYTQIQFLGVWLGDTAMTLAPGEGVFMNVPSATTVTFVGEVMQGTLINPLATLDIKSSMVPQTGGITAVLGLTPSIGDTVNEWNGPGAAPPYTQSQFLGVWLPSEPSIDVGQAFWLSVQAPRNWTRNFTIP
jgi:hypothetical protein